MDIKAKREQYTVRLDELSKYREKLAAELEKVDRTLIALGGAIEALDDLMKEEAVSSNSSDPEFPAMETQVDQE